MNLRTSVIARLVVMGMILLGLLIPLSMVEAVVSERTTRRDSVANDISSTWGSAQLLAGPMLTVPYECTVVENDGRSRQIIGRATFLPETLNVQGSLTPDVRKRGLFKVVVYAAQLTVTGRFAAPDLSIVTRGSVRPLLNEASVNLGVADSRGVSRATLNWNGIDRRLEPGIGDTAIALTGLHARIDLTDPANAGKAMTFTMTLQLNGSRDFRIVPAGNDTSVRLSSSWPHPSFIGASPQPRTVESTGFTAGWDISYFGRGFPRAWSDPVDRDKMRSLAEGAAFGVSLVQPVDIYQQTERAVKYAALFIVLTFVVFFLFEVVRARLLHPVQYVFVGFALCVFYLLLISLSEHLGFDLAYAAAAAAITLLISSYSSYVLGGLTEAAVVGACIGAVYGFLYLLLRIEDYALLAGSIGLFLALTLVMLLTRRVNWYELRLGGRA